MLVAPVNSDDWIVHCDAPKTIALRVSYRYEVVTPTTFTVSACEAMGQVGYPCDGPAVHTTVTVVPPGYTLTLAPTSVTAGDSVTATLTRSVRQGFNGGWYVFDIDPNHCTMATQPCPYQATVHMDNPPSRRRSWLLTSPHRATCRSPRHTRSMASWPPRSSWSHLYPPSAGPLSSGGLEAPLSVAGRRARS